MAVVRVVVSIASEKVTEMVELAETPTSESDGDVEETVGAVASTVKEVTLRVLEFPALSIKVMVQLL